MATKYLDLPGLGYYDGKLKGHIAAAVGAVQDNVDAEASARELADSALSGRISDLENAGYVTKAVNDLTNYYTKSQTYTQTEVNTLIGNLKTIQIEVVQSLPVTGQSNYIYLVPKAAPATGYTEYLWISSQSKYEEIGDTNIDLSNYYNKTEVNNLLSGKQDSLTFDNAPTSGSSNPVTSGGVYTGLDGKVDKVSGKGLSTNDYTTTEKNKLAGIAAGAEVNVNADWNASTGDAQILNKPTKLSQFTNDLTASISNSEIDALFS